MRNKICYQTIRKAMSAGFKMQKCSGLFSSPFRKRALLFQNILLLLYTILLLLQFLMKPLNSRMVSELCPMKPEHDVLHWNRQNFTTVNQRMEVIILFVDDFYFIYLFFHMTCNFICIYLVICFHFVFVYRTVNVMSFHALTVHARLAC